MRKTGGRHERKFQVLFLLDFGYVHQYKHEALSPRLIILKCSYWSYTVNLLPMRSILSLLFFSFVSIAICLTLAPEGLLTDQVSPSNNLELSSGEYDLSGQVLSDNPDANNDACTSDAGATGNAAERRNLVARGKVCVPPVQRKNPAGVQPTSSKQPSKINPDLPGHLDNLPESYPLLHLKPTELNLDEEFCPPTMASERIYAYCDSGLTLDRIIHDTFEPRSWDLLRCEDCKSFVI